ncbi:MAG: hypothetical protein HY753_03665 [Nitrospirae bacterium]|nr:hypothetical protein [Nitrospirota bacterium]
MLLACWEIKKCGREKGGRNEKSLGVCPAYPDHGHSCWIVAGTFCHGKIRGTFAQKETMCIECEVYKLYSMTFGKKKAQFKKEYLEEYNNCVVFFKNLEK